MNELPKSQVLNLVLTTDDREKLLYEIETLKNSLYGSSSDKFENALKNEVRLGFSQIIAEEIQGQDPGHYLETLYNQLLELQEVKLEIAYEASMGSISRIHEVLVRLIGYNIIIDLSINKYILGGTVIIFRGKYLDLSMRKIFDAEVKSAREGLLNMLEKKVSA